jgi:autotransporter-associated beta strand protein
MNQTRLSVRALLVSGAFLVLGNAVAQADSATWHLNPTNGDWFVAANWTPTSVPNGIDQTATFGVSNVTDVTVSSTLELLDLVFDPGASAYSMTVPTSIPLAIYGTGIVNNSGVTQRFSTLSSGFIGFYDRTGGGHPPASAGTNTEFTVPAGGTIQFTDDTSAGQGTFSGSGDIVFFLSATAADGVFTISGPSGLHTITFNNLTSAGNSTLIATAGGIISFEALSVGGTVRVELFDGGQLWTYLHNLPGVTIGSLEGNGVALIGSAQFNRAVKLTIGSNNLDTTFSGQIGDAGFGGSIQKIGTGALTLSGANTYGGGTTVSQGALVVSNASGSATGTGAVSVTSGTLGGGGIISGTVTIGGGASAFLAPAFGSNKQVTLTLQGSLNLASDSTYTYTFKARTSQTRADLVVANGVTINGATIRLKGKTQGTLTLGTVLTVISNTSANPISGTFSNLADGAIVTVNGSNLQASYIGGDGNDLTLTVVP